MSSSSSTSLAHPSAPRSRPIVLTVANALPRDPVDDRDTILDDTLPILEPTKTAQAQEGGTTPPESPTSGKSKTQVDSRRRSPRLKKLALSKDEQKADLLGIGSAFAELEVKGAVTKDGQRG